jgi:Cys-tRNA(Pro)/Cys-tRNA(Cys) deacylase
VFSQINADKSTSILRYNLHLCNNPRELSLKERQGLKAGQQFFYFCTSVFCLQPAKTIYLLNHRMTKTNAARILDAMGIHFELIPYQVDETDLSAPTVAKKLGQNIEQVFKTLVLRGDKTGVFVCVIPGGEELDLKKAAKVSENKNSAMVPMKEILELTGYIRGGCSPLGMKKKYPIYIDETCTLHEFIFISAGIRGLQIKIAPDDLIKSTGALICDLI